ncbi:MAG: FAD-dependent oxidoreductase [Gammaproteobacteria bacterium]|nr:FAD-dependent oxidoreductase [Gammaproteobacteria bacterium]NNF49329.1 FAD-dependent oxidoreductase [Woeseiaceae bacterium]MBT8094914.1 FAD-dependent oxidoreductase [Gammaproteobacteria bacterium]MBT8104518.1 FAD-dependent oxidoreductase [Gammaproteobacteria bacterium]NNK24532.1 FAD-dependent oxidoreductase [Woeseiaceae bacterium]
MSETIVIAGAGHAAGQVVASLRQYEFDGRIVLVGDEPYLPYQRPPLSKKFLAGEMPAERLYFKPESFYEGVHVHLETRIAAIDREAGCVMTDAGETIAYDKLVLALGSRVRRLPVEGADLPGVHYLRSIADVEGIRKDLDKGKSLVVIGAGYIGLEVAAVAQQAGLDVTVLETEDRVMSRVVSPEVSDFYQIQHTNHGVKLRLATSATSIDGKRRVRAVTTSAGESVPADLVVIGVGIVPNTELAIEAGLEVDNGIIVDDRCVTSDPDIYAVGDCTLHPNGIYDRNLRLESVHNALEQAKTAAANICGRDAAYCQVPWFWSDQYDLKLQIAGLSEGYDEVVIRGNPAQCSFSCIYLKNEHIIATDAINAARDFVQSKQLIENRVEVSAEQLADAEVQLKELAG